MAEVGDFQRVDAENTTIGRAGMPEQMDRDLVNNQYRAGIGAVKRFYADGEWVNLLKEQDSFTVTRLRAERTAAVWARISSQHRRSSTILLTARTCPSIRLRPSTRLFLASSARYSFWPALKFGIGILHHGNIPPGGIYIP